MNYISGNYFLTLEQMQVNAVLIYRYLIQRGWTLNSISAMLGNMQTESTINPGIYENLDSSLTTNGFGLVQWTPNTKYKNWVDSEYGDSDYGNLYYNLERIIYEVINNLQWIPTYQYNISFNDFKYSTDTPENLAYAFLYNYERPASLDQPIRKTQARYWYDYLYPIGPIPVNVENKKFKWVLFGRKNKKYLLN